MFKAGILDHKGRGLKLHLDKMKAEESRTKLVKPERFEGKFVWDATLEVETWRPRGEDRRLLRITARCRQMFGICGRSYCEISKAGLKLRSNSHYLWL